MRRHENHPDIVDVPDLTDQQIKAVMCRAHALRCRTARDPLSVTAITLAWHEAKRATQQYYFYTRWYGRMRGESESETIWMRIGWIEHRTTSWGFRTALGQDCYHETWEVLYDVGTDRVWLRFRRLGRVGENDLYP